MHELHLLLNLIKTHEKALGLLFTVGGLTISVSLQAILHKFAIKSPLVAFLLSKLEAVAATAVAYKASGDSVAVLPTYATLWIGSQVFHRVAVNPVYYKWVLPFLEWLNSSKEVLTPAEPAASETPSFS